VQEVHRRAWRAMIATEALRCEICGEPALATDLRVDTEIAGM
jgi:hypothetical protein